MADFSRSAWGKQKLAILNYILQYTYDKKRINPSQSRIALATGIERTTVSRLLKELAQDGLVTRHYGKFKENIIYQVPHHFFNPAYKRLWQPYLKVFIWFCFSLLLPSSRSNDPRFTTLLDIDIRNKSYIYTPFVGVNIPQEILKRGMNITLARMKLGKVYNAYRYYIKVVTELCKVYDIEVNWSLIVKKREISMFQKKLPSRLVKHSPLQEGDALQMAISNLKNCITPEGRYKGDLPRLMDQINNVFGHEGDLQTFLNLTSFDHLRFTDYDFLKSFQQEIKKLL